MTTRPTASPAFATDATFTSGTETGLVPRLDPGAGFKQQGWYPNRRMPARWFNWIIGIFGDWLQYLAQKTDGTFSPFNYAGVGDGTVDDTTAVQNCFNAAATASNDGQMATVDLGGKAWRVTAALYGKPDINVKNGRLILDHATANFIDFDSSPAGLALACQWENVQLDIAQANTGIILGASVPGVSVEFKNCRFNNSGLCTGRLLLSASGSDFRFDHCYGKVPLNGPGFRSDAGVLEIEGGKWTTPLNYADSIVEGTGGTHRLTGVHFLTSSTTGGNAICVHVAGQKVIANGCLFDDGSGNGNKAFFSVLGAGVGDLTEHASVFRGMTAYTFAAPLALGSVLSLRNPQATTIAAAGTVVCTDGIKAQSFKLTNAFSGNGPSLQLPAILFVGQEFEITVWNASGTNWTLGIATDSAIGDGSGAVNDDRARAMRFRALNVKADGTPRWNQMSEATSSYALP